MTDAAAPLVSVVVPVFNGEVTIERTLRSVLAQTLADFEIVVVDDGSKDGTAGIVRGIGDGRIRLFQFPNAGLPASRNRGVAAARGEFIAFLDADDLWRPDKLRRQVDALRSAPAAVLAYSLSDAIDEDDRFLSHGTHVVAEGRVYEQLLAFNFLDNGSTPLLRADALRAAGPFDTSVPIAADWDMWLRLAFGHEFVCVNEVQVLYRVHANAMSSNVVALERQSLAVLGTALGRLPPDERRRLEPVAVGNVYFYCAGRALGTARAAADGRLAARYAWASLRTAPAGSASWRGALGQLAKGLMIATLPRAWWRRAFGWIAAARRR